METAEHPLPETTDALAPSGRMLSMREAAEYAGIPYSTWTKLYRIWAVPHFKVGKHVLFRECEVSSWLETKRVQ